MSGRFMIGIAEDAAKDFAEAGESTAKSISEKLISGVADTEEGNLEKTLAQDAEQAANINKVLDGMSGDSDAAAASIDANASSAASSTEAAGEGDLPKMEGDDFDGGRTGGQGSEGDGETPSCNDPIDPVSGQMMTAREDLRLPGVLPLILRRAYASGYRHGRLFGPGWSSTLDQRLVIDETGIHYLGDDAQILTYQPPAQPGQQVLPAAGARWPLAWDRHTDAITILDPATGHTRHFPPPPRDAGVAGATQGHEVRWLTRITDRNQNWLTVTRDTDGVPTQVEHAGGYRIAVDSGYRADGFRVEALRLLDPAHPEGTTVAAFSYDPAGRLVEVLDPQMRALTYAHDDAGRINAWIDRGGYRYDYAYDEAGRVIHVEGEDGTLAADFHYDTDARSTRVIDSAGNVTEYRYDEHNHLIELVDPLGAATRMTHDRYGRLIEHTDPLGHTTRLVRDPAGSVLELHRADGTRVTVAYNDLQQPVRITAPDGGVTTLAYDEAGNLLALTDPCGAQTRYTYNDRGGLIAATDPLGHTTALSVDAAGLPTTLTDPLGAVWSATRDARGNVLRQTDPLGHPTTTAYDDEGRPTARTYPDGSRATWTYDARGNLTRHTDPAGHETTYEYGPFRRLRARVDPDGARFEFAYDRELRLTSVRNPLRAQWTYTYDPAGNLTGEQDFNGRRVTYAHDAAGQLVQRTNGAEETIAFTRDALGRITEHHLPDGQSTTFTYREDGELLRATGDGVEISFTRDSVGRVLAETVDGASLTATYDAGGNRTSRVTPSGRASRWEYDAAGRALALLAGEEQVSFGYDAAGRESHRWLGGATALTNEWDPMGRLTARRLLEVTGAGDARTARILHERAWTYRADGSPESVTDPADGTRTLQLDPAGRVTAVNAATWTEQYAYDALGNLTFSADSRNEHAPTAGPRESTGTLLHRAGRTAYEYDAQGRLVKTVRRTLSGGRKTWTFAYDAYDRMRQAVTPEGECWHYRYDPLGRRIAKQLRGEDGEIRTQTLFTWDGAVLAEQRESPAGGQSQAVVTAWDYEPESWTPIVQDRRTYYADAPQTVVDRRFHAIVTDLVGAPTELVSTDGEIAWRRSAGLWGANAHADALPDALLDDCPLRFPGQYHDAETGLHYNYQRYYDPDTGRYATPDPLGLAPAPNQHAYVTNPLGWLDPFGLSGGTYYRGSRGTDEPTFTAKPNEFRVDPKTGLVKPTHGVSLFDNKESIASKGFEPNEVDPATVPDTLQIKQRGNDKKHFEIMPADDAKLTPEQYQSELGKIKTKAPTTACE